MPTAPAPSIFETGRSPAEVLDACFLETRAKLLEIAANLDRVDRSMHSSREFSDQSFEMRMAFVQGALKILQSSAPNRAEQIQLLYSLK